MTISNLNLPNKAPESGFINTMLQTIETGLYAHKYLTQATAVVTDTTGKYSFAQIQDAYQFIVAFQSRTNFVSTISLGSQFPAGTEVKLSLFSNNLLVQTVGTDILTQIKQALQQIGMGMDDPTGYPGQWYDQVKLPNGQAATRYDLLTNPNQAFYFEFSNSNSGLPIWSTNNNQPPPWANGIQQDSDDDGGPFTDYYQINVDANGNEIPGGGFTERDHYNEFDDGGTEEFKVTCNNANGEGGLAIANYSVPQVLNQNNLNNANSAVTNLLAML